MKNKKDWTILLVGFLGALKLFLTSLGINFITDDMINSFVDMLSFGVALYAVWKNTYVSNKAKKQKEVLEKNKLI